MSFYNNRPSYVQASWINRSLFPLQEPTFPPNSNSSPPLQVQNDSSASSTSIEQNNLTSPLPSLPAPPPLYFRGEQHRNNSNNNDSNLTSSHQIELELAEQNLARSYYPTTSTTKSLSTAIISWDYHPTITKSYLESFNRPKLWYNSCLSGKNKGERLSKQWPKSFGGGTIWRSDIVTGLNELRTGDSRGRDSGFGRISSEEEDNYSYDPSRYSTSSNPRPLSTTFSNTNTNSDSNPSLLPIHPNSADFISKLTVVNDLLHFHLIKTRIILSLLEFILWVIGFLIIAALIVDKGQQGTFIQAVELTVIVWIILSGIGIGVVRMQRNTLVRSLMYMAREWNPLPITTNSHLAGFGNNQNDNHYLSPDPPSNSSPPTVDEAALLEARREDRRKELEEASKPKLRWNFRSNEGWFHLGYRTIVKVELFTPSSFNHHNHLRTVLTNGSVEVERIRTLERVVSNSNSNSHVRRFSTARVPVPLMDIDLEANSSTNREGEGDVVPPYSRQV